MNFYNQQRSRSFTEFCPGCLRFIIFIFSSKIARLIETRLHVEPLWNGGMKVNGFGSNDQDIHHANIWQETFEIFFSGLERLKTLKLVFSFEDSDPTRFSDGEHWLTLT